MTQLEVAEYAGISNKTLSLIEIGKQQNPSIQTIMRIAEILTVDVDDLLVGVEPKTNINMLRRFDKLDKEDKKIVSKFIDFCLEKDTRKLIRREKNERGTS